MRKLWVTKGWWGLVLALSAISAQADLTKIFAKVDPAVVVILSREHANRLNEAGFVQEVSHDALGTGVLIDERGTILTASHVVHTADELTVVTRDNKQWPARVRSTLTQADIAVIEIVNNEAKFPFVTLGNSDEVQVGQDVFVIGTPYGLEHTLTHGLISGRRFETQMGSSDKLEFLQTDAAVNQGNSGGPLFDLQGRVIGIISYIATQSGGSEGLGFAASSNMVRQRLLGQPDFWGGLELEFLDATMANVLNSPTPSGALVQRVARGSFGERIGLRGGYFPVSIKGHTLILGGDIIIGLGDEMVKLDEKLVDRARAYFSRLKSGDMIKMIVLRNGRLEELTAPKP